MNRQTLLALFKDDLVSLVQAQQAQIEALSGQVQRPTARITDLEARLDALTGTASHSSIPPSKGQKPDSPERPSKPRRGRPGTCRASAANPDRIVQALLTTCPHCAHALSPANQPLVRTCDPIDLPPIRPILTRINRHRGVCPCCRRRVAAPPPEGFEPGSSFGPGLRARHPPGRHPGDRLRAPGLPAGGGVRLALSNGAIANILVRAGAPLPAAAVPVDAAARESPVVGSDETTARVGGKTWWQWMLLGGAAICHVIAEGEPSARSRAEPLAFLALDCRHPRRASRPIPERRSSRRSPSTQPGAAEGPPGSSRAAACVHQHRGAGHRATGRHRHAEPWRSACIASR